MENNFKVDPYLRDIMRGKILEWNKVILKNHDYKCDITGQETKCVHHVTPYTDILKMAIAEFGYQTKEKYSNYNKEELSQLGNKLLELHYLHGEGVPLLEEIHNIFHSEYGISKHTKEDYDNFKKSILEDKEGFTKYYSDKLEKYMPKPKEESWGKAVKAYDDMKGSMNILEIEFGKKFGVDVKIFNAVAENIKEHCNTIIEQLKEQPLFK